jgi:hypothetical protein
MLFAGIIIFLLILIAFLYATAKLTVYLEKSPYINIFYVLMFITFITVIEIMFCAYLYFSFRTKDGEEGPRGFQGFPGEKGDPGKCNQILCRADSLRVMIQKIFEKKLGRRLNENEKRNLYENNTDRIKHNSSVKIINKEGTSTPKLIIELTLEDVKTLYDRITEYVQLGYYRVDNKESLRALLKKYFVL